MKTQISLLSLIFIVFTSLSSCTWAGQSGKKETTSTLNNKTGILISKNPSDFDKKFGYEIMVWKTAEDSLRQNISVFVPKKTWERLPVPNDSTEVTIEYIEDVEYGNNRDNPSFWDFQFNLCTGFTVNYPPKKNEGY